MKFLLRGVVCGAAGMLAAFGWLFAATGPASSSETSTAAAAAKPEPNWIRGTEEERLAQIAKHLRGLDTAMIETGHRYGELFWAGKDRNWEYAAYQLDKIRYSLELAIERRPKRATSAQPFLLVAVPQMKEAIAAKDRALFEERFVAFTALCNACHALENVAYMQVVQPTQRLSPIKFTAP